MYFQPLLILYCAYQGRSEGERDKEGEAGMESVREGGSAGRLEDEGRGGKGKRELFPFA